MGIQSKLRWFTCERKEWLCVVAAAGLIGFGFGNGHTTQNAIEDISVQVGCEQQKTRKVTAIAKTAIKAATDFSVNPPDAKALPKNDCAPKD